MHRLTPPPDLVDAIRAAFAAHVEVEARAGSARLLRIAGYELKLNTTEPAPQLQEQVCERLAEVAVYGVASALADESPAGTRRRMELVSTLAALEAAGRGPRHLAPDGSELLTTVEAAAELGMSRPYVSMLCDQGKLGEVSRSEGGHRRIRRDALEAYRRARERGDADGEGA